MGGDHFRVDVLVYDHPGVGAAPFHRHADKEKIPGASTPVPPTKVFDADLGGPPCWREAKSKELWSAMLKATNAG